MKHLVCVGACYVDTILDVEHYPAEDEKLRASKISHRRGGNCPNSLQVLEQLVHLSGTEDLSLILLSVLPSSASAAAQYIKDSFGGVVDLTHCIHREGFQEPASSYILKSLANGSRTIVNYNTLPEMTVSEFEATSNTLGEDAVWYHFEGRIPHVTLECIRHLRRSHPTARISVEVEKPGRPGLQELAAEADMVFYSKSWAQHHQFRSAGDCLKAQAALTPKAESSFCTWGEEGASVIQLPSLTLVHSPAYSGDDFRVVDTIGAGDTFIAGVLFAVLFHKRDWTVEDRLRFANELAGRKVSQEGFSGLGELVQHII